MRTKRLEAIYEEKKGTPVYIVKNKHGLQVPSGDFVPKSHYIIQNASNGNVITSAINLAEMEDYIVNELE